MHCTGLCQSELPRPIPRNMALILFGCVALLGLVRGTFYTLDNVTSGISDSDVRRVVQDFVDVCTGTSLCNAESTWVANSSPEGIMLPCCDVCRCDDACLESNDCCPDVIPHVLSTSEITETYAGLTTCEITEVSHDSVTWNTEEAFSGLEFM